MDNYFLPFASLQVSLSSAGGKGANLAALALAGFNVPPGFVLNTAAYRAFVDANAIQSRLLELASSVAPDDPLSLDNASAQIHDLFTQGSMPAEVARSLEAAYADLSAQAVAVRSSATAEDLPGLSFAGQQETYLNVLGVAALREAVLQCWASLWTARALGYRARNRIPAGEVALAVVVQQMIASDVSGVMFTANPLTGRRDEIVIDASFGLGEAIVAGQVEPDHYVVDARSMQPTTRKLGAKALAILPRAGGGTERVAQANAGRQALSDEQMELLAFIGQRVQAHFGSPQDVEWAIAGGDIYLLQSRPITSLYPLPDQPANPDDERLYFSMNVVQGMLDPFTPLSLGVLRSLASGFPLKREPRQLVPVAGGRAFIDVTDIARDPRLRRALLAILARGDPASRLTLL